MPKRKNEGFPTAREVKKLKVSPREVTSVSEKCVDKTLKASTTPSQRSESDMSLDSPQNESCSRLDSAPRRSKTCRYQKNWEKIDMFKDWIEQVGTSEYRCKWCDSDRSVDNKCVITPQLAKRFNVERHAKSEAHCKIAEKMGKQNNAFVDIVNTQQTDLDDSVNDEYADSTDSDKAGDAEKTKKVVGKKLGVKTHKKQYFESTQMLKKIEESIKKFSAELRYAGMIACTNNSFSFGGDLLKFLKVLLNDSETIQLMSLDRKKIPAIYEKIIAPTHKEQLAEILTRTEFSVCIDESTDVAGHSSICIVVRYPCEEKGEIRDTLWDLVPSYEGDENKAEANAPYIVKKVLDTFRDAKIPLNNIIAFCSDTCPLMMGKKSGVSTLLMQEIPHIAIVECDCHKENLITRDAMKKFPPQVMELMVAIPKYVQKSAKKIHNWKGLQEKLKLEYLMLLLHALTRWTSRYKLVLRSLRRWEALLIYFEREVQVNPSKKGGSDEDADKESKTVEWICQQLQDPLMYAYVVFVESQLSRLEQVNVLLQSEKPIVSDYKGTMADLFIEFLHMYMKDEYVGSTPIEDIDPEDNTHFKPLEELYIGQITRDHLLSKEMQDTSFDVEEFLKVCQSFQIEVCKKIKEKCNFKCYSYFFNKSNVLNRTFHKTNPSLDCVFDAFLQLNVDRKIVNTEWASLGTHTFPEKIMLELQKIKRTDHFWYKLKSYKDESTNTYCFKNLAKFAVNVVSVPNSNAASERVWSTYNRAMPASRASKKFSTVRAELLSAQYVKDQGGILKFLPCAKMLDRMNITSLQSRKKKGKPVLDQDSDRTKFGTVEITNARKKKALKEELLYCTKYSDHDKINFGEINALLNVDDLHASGEIKSSPDEDDTLKSVLPLQDLAEQVMDNSLSDEGFILDDIPSKNENHDESNVIEACTRRTSNVKYFNEYNEIGLEIELRGATMFEINQEINVGDASITDNKIRMEVPLKPVSNDNFRIKRMANWLINDPSYYTNSHDYRLLGRYKTGKKNHPLRDLYNESKRNVIPPNFEQHVFVSEYKTLLGSTWVNGDIIDAFGMINEEYWQNTIFLTTQHTKILLVDIDSCEKTWFMLHVKYRFTGKILMPLEFDGHWTLFIVDVDRHLTIHIDPLHQKSSVSAQFFVARKNRAEMCHTNFLKYLNKLKNFTGDMNNLHAIEWTNVYCADDRAYQNDGSSCGPFVMNLMDHIGRGIPFEKYFNPHEYREYAIKLLLNYSKSMEHYCLYCYGSKDRSHVEEILCMYCERYAHENCRPYEATFREKSSFSTSSTEGQVEMKYYRYPDGTVRPEPSQVLLSTTVKQDRVEVELIKNFTDFDRQVCGACTNYCRRHNIPMDGKSESSSQSSNSSHDSYNDP